MVLQEVNLNLLTKNLVLPTDGIKLQAPNTRLFVGEAEYGKGLLCVAERYIFKNNLFKVLKIDFYLILIIATSRGKWKMIAVYV